MVGRAVDGLGLRTIALDNARTWSARTGRNRRRDYARGAFWYYGWPLVAALPTVKFHVAIQSVTPLLTGVTIFTGLLFGLLALVFNMGVTLRKDGDSLKSAHDLNRTIRDLRANITYSALACAGAAGIMIGAGALTPANTPLCWFWTPIVVWLFVHVGLNLLTVLRRFRAAFNYLTL